jgi:two-component system chemotaxis response regulator CheB
VTGPLAQAVPGWGTTLRAADWQALQGRSLEAIAIGTSAGGVEALATLLPALPARLAVPVLVVLHLPRDRPSLLVDIFGPRCALPVQEALDKLPVSPGTVVFAPPDYHLLVDAGLPGADAHVVLSVDPPVNYSRPSIDVLFDSAADVYGPALLAILLTGANQDGAAGLQAVRRAGGMALVQEPATAEAPYMPASALQAGPVDLVLPLARMAALLRSL